MLWRRRKGYYTLVSDVGCVDIEGGGALRLSFHFGVDVSFVTSALWVIDRHSISSSRG